MRFPALITTAVLLWPAAALAHGDPTDHIHPHGAVALPYQALFVLAGLVVAVGLAAMARNFETAERIRRTVGDALRRRGPRP